MGHRLTSHLVHDPCVLPWFIVAGYFLAAFLSFRAASVAVGRERHLWLGCVAALIFLGFNKQLDLQTDLTDLVRRIAHDEGWYMGYRRDVQGVFLAVLALASVLISILLWRWLRDAAASARVAAVGAVILLAFIFARAASFHHLDYWVTLPVAGMRAGWWLEVLGIGVIGGAAAIYRDRAGRGLRRRRAKA